MKIRDLRPVLAAWSLTFLTACALPQWRVFQKRIDPKVAEKPAAQVEAERQGAKYIAQSSARVEADPAAQIQRIHEVAVPLSASLGEPLKTIPMAEHAAAVEALSRGLRAEQDRAEKWRKFALTYASRPVEGTGINLAGPAGLVGLAAVVALCVLVPSFGWAVLRGLPVLWGYFRKTAAAVKEFADSHPDAGQKLVSVLSRKMDTAHKRLVRARAKPLRVERVV